MAGELEGVQKALRELGKSLKNLPKDPAPSEIHRLRTASRRAEAVAVVLPRSEQKKSRRFAKALEPVRKAAGEVRDMDVLGANARTLARRRASESLNRLIGQLENARQQNAQELLRALHGWRKSLRNDLEKYSKLVESVLTPAKSRNGHSGQPQESVHAAARRVLGGWELGAAGCWKYP